MISPYMGNEYLRTEAWDHNLPTVAVQKMCLCAYCGFGLFATDFSTSVKHSVASCAYTDVQP
jgi:hypothetical protein